jgi:hypothetical protein
VRGQCWKPIHNQVIEHRRRIAIPNEGGDAETTILTTDFIKEVGRTCETTDPVDQPNSVIDGGDFATKNLGVAWSNR